MSLSSKIISAVQKAGTAASAADVELKKAVSNYAARVNEVLLKAPFGANSDVAYEQWKALARVSQSLTGIEAELRRVFDVLADLVVKDDLSQTSKMPALATTAPTVEHGARNQSDLAPTDVLVKSKKKSKSASARKGSARQTKAPVRKPLTPPSPSLAPKLNSGEKKNRPKALSASLARTSEKPQELKGNPAKLLTYLATVLNAKEFTATNQTAIAKVTGIPLGSLTAANKKLIELGKILPGPTGSYKLAALQ